MFYQNERSDLDELDFKVARRVTDAVLREGSLWGLPEKNLAGFEGPNGLFCYARQKMSEDGEWLLIASLAGSIKLAVEGLNVSEPIGLVCVQGEDWRARDSSVTKFGKAWAPMTGAASGNIRAKKVAGRFEPLSKTMVTRGLEGTTYEHWVVLPCMPASVKKKNGKAYLECEGEVFVLEDPQQVKAAVNGKATWIVPDENGNFVFP